MLPRTMVADKYPFLRPLTEKGPQESLWYAPSRLEHLQQEQKRVGSQVFHVLEAIQLQHPTIETQTSLILASIEIRLRLG
jgi:hypothetical protein